MALKRVRLGLPHPSQVGRGIDGPSRTAPRRDSTRGAIKLRSLIAHGIGVGGVRREARSLALAAATATLLLSVRLTTRRAAPISPPDLRELETSGLGSTATRAVLLASVAGATDRELGAAPTTPLETDGVDASATRAFALRGPAGSHDELWVAHHVGHQGRDQIELVADVQRSG